MPTDAMRRLRGTKRACRSCDVRFYDLGRDPTVCPICGASLPMSGFEPVRQQAVGYQPSSLRAPKPKLAVVQVEDHPSALAAITADTGETTEDEAPSDADSDVLLEEEGDDDVADLLTPDESANDSE